MVNRINKLALRRNSFLKASISVRDKEISFDGHIDVLKDNSEKKEAFLGKVHVQVKSTGVDQFSTGNVSFSFDLKDIKNYLKTSGVLLIVGEVSEDETEEDPPVKLFYKSLLPLEIDSILTEYKDQKSRTIQLRPLEETSLYKVCMDFLETQKKQPLAVVTQKPFHVSEFREYSIDSLSPVNEDDLFKEKFALYGIKNNVYIPLSLAKLEEIAFDRSIEYLVNDTKYNIFTRTQIKDSNLKMILEDVFEINIDSSKGEFSYGHLENRSLSAQLKLQPFLYDLFSGLEIQFLDQFIKLPIFSEAIEEWEKHQVFLNELHNTFIILNIDLNLKMKYDESLLWQLHHLINLVYHKDYTLTKKFNFGFLTFDLDEHKVVFLKMNGELYNAFSSIVSSLDVEVQRADGERFKHSPFGKLEEDVLATSINLDIKEIQNSFDLFNPFMNDTVHIYTDDFCIKCINAYSISEKVELLDLVEYIYNKSNGTDVEKMESMIVNRFQIKAWKGEELNQEELRLLMRMRRDAIVNGNHTLCACVSILLKDKEEVSMSIDALTPEEQTTLKEWPIYKLHLKLLGD